MELRQWDGDEDLAASWRDSGRECWGPGAILRLYFGSNLRSGGSGEEEHLGPGLPDLEKKKMQDA